MRTPARNWKLGQQNVNILLLAVVWREVALPLLFDLLPHGGSSDTQTRHVLLDDVLCLLSCTHIRVLYADREFIGEAWIGGLVQRGIPPCVRLQVDMMLDEWRADDWLARLPPEAGGLWCEDIEVYVQPMKVVLTHTAGGEPFIIAINTGAVWEIQTRYRRRFRIECLFRALKTKGFNFENTHMTLHDHVERLLCLLTIAYVWCVLVGVVQEVKHKSHGRRAWSVITLGLQTWCWPSANQGVYPLSLYPCPPRQVLENCRVLSGSLLRRADLARFKVAARGMEKEEITSVPAQCPTARGMTFSV